jgi:hypothetical protein
MAANDNEPIPREIISLRGESSFVDNDVKVEVYAATNDKLHHPSIIVADGQAALIGNDMDIRVSYGMPLPLKPAQVKPAQVPTTEPEKSSIRQELRELAQRIDELFRDDYPLSPREASERSGLGEDWQAVLNWRRNLEENLRARYINEIRPRIVDTYERARVKGFFDPELEESYTSRVLIVIETLPGLLRRVAAKS